MSVPELTAADLLARVTSAAPHLRWRVGDPVDGDLLGAELADNPELLATTIAASAQGRGSDDAQVLASLWWQGYAYRVAGTTLACWLLTRAAPDTGAAVVAVGVARSRPSSVVFLPSAGPAASDLPLICERLFGKHLDPVAISLRARHQLGSQLVWGNVAAACASAVGAVRDAAGAGWHSRVEEFLAAAPHELATRGDWTEVSDGEPSFRRRSCCLWWKTTAAAGALCADCSLTRPSTDPASTVPR